MTVVLAAVPHDLPSAAVDYARAGFEVFPLHENKAPRTTNGMKDATTDEAVVKQWWSQWPDALIGCRVPRDVVILDIDTRHGGMATWTALRTAYGTPPSTRAHYSGRGDKGGHLWFKRPAEKIRATGLHAWAKQHGTGEAAGKHSWVSGIDLLHHGHRYTILPPSPHPETHKPYWWADGHGPDTQPAAMPSWLAALLVEPPAPPRTGLEIVPLRPDDSIADWFSDTFSWSDLLVPEGWMLVRGDGDSDGSAWRHPNATSVQSATVKNGCLFVYTPNTDFEPTEEGDPHGYTRFRAYAVMSHHGDMSAAAMAARRMKGDGGNLELPATLTGGVGTEEAPARAELTVGDVESSWTERSLGPVLEGIANGTIERPTPTVGVRSDGKALFYPGRINALWGESGDGKSWAALYACSQEIDQGNHVIYVDYEDDDIGTVSRLLQLGLTPDAIDTYLHYFWPDSPATLDDIQGHLRAVIHQHQPTLAVIDSAGESMAIEGVKPNDDDAVARWFRVLPSLFSRSGSAVVVIDHVTKDREQRGLYAIGSQRKRAAVNGAAYMVEAIKPFGMGMAGLSKLVVAKDRNGNYLRGHKAAEFHLDCTVGTRVSLVAPEPAGGFRPTRLMEKTSVVLEGLDEPISKRQLQKLVTGKNDDSKSLALDLLVKEGYVEKRPARNGFEYLSVSAFREDDDIEKLVNDAFFEEGNTP